MIRYTGLKFQVAVDVAFVFILAPLYFILRSSLPLLQYEVKVLFSASYVMLMLSILVLFLIFGMNQKFALLTHVALFPMLSIFYLFLKWMPDAIRKVGGMPPYGSDPGMFSANMLAYLIVLFGYFIGQLVLYLHEQELVPYHRPIE